MKSNINRLALTDLEVNSLSDLGLNPTSQPRLHFIFGPSSLQDSKEFQNFLSKFPAQDITIGCSTAGTITNQYIDDDSVTLSTITFSNTQIKSASYPIHSADDSRSVGENIARELNKEDLRGIIVLSDGLQVNGTQLIQGINSVVDPKVVVTGGLAGDGARFQSTWVIVEGHTKSGYVTAVGLYGESVSISHGSQGGWDIFGPERIITRSKGNVVFKIDNQPALDLYKKYLGEKAKDLPASGLLFPLQIWNNKKDNAHVVRTILAVNETENSITFAGDMPEGYSAQFMRASFNRLIEGASHAADDLCANDPGLALSISCVGRKLLLGERTEEETEAVLEKLPKGSQQIGFYSYGEISPLVKGEACKLHNQTMTVTFISESEKRNAA